MLALWASTSVKERSAVSNSAAAKMSIFFRFNNNLSRLLLAKSTFRRYCRVCDAFFFTVQCDDMFLKFFNLNNHVFRQLSSQNVLFFRRCSPSVAFFFSPTLCLYINTTSNIISFSVRCSLDDVFAALPPTGGGFAQWWQFHYLFNFHYLFLPPLRKTARCTMSFYDMNSRECEARVNYIEGNGANPRFADVSFNEEGIN
jgi:hypothetical protein